MSTFLESQRSTLEEIDTLELAISQRLKRNPDLLPEAQRSSGDDILASAKKRPYKETLIQEHELKFFIDKYKRQCVNILENKENKLSVFLDELSQLDDPSFEFSKFDTLLQNIKQRHEMYNEGVPAEDINKIYAMYSSASPIEKKRATKDKVKVKRKHILSLSASHIDLDTIFTPDELYGKYLDLLPFYKIYKSNFDHNISYIEYLSIYDKLPYENAKRHTSVYADYIHILYEYLKNFLERAKPLFDISKLTDELNNDFLLLNQKEVDKYKDGEPNEKGEVYCKTCDKLFAKETVYKGHLNGKKHHKNLKSLSTTENSTPSPSRIKDLEQNEFKIKRLSEFLKKYKELAIANAERIHALTERERILEAISVAGEESEYTTVGDSTSGESDEDSSSDDENYKDLPIGIDGKPIPYWLYKLQGLHQTYDCEICGDITYKGRTVFAKHFNGVKHQHGLRCLGISDDFIPLFKSIVKIDEALDLWRRLKREKRIKEGDVENAVEVEDEEGNVMSEKDYLELKKQGLL